MIDCRHGVAGRQPDQLIASTGEERIGPDENCIDALLDEARKGRVNIVFTARIQDRDTFPPGRLKLETRPRSTGSVPVVKMIGIVAVAAWAATAAGGASAMIAATGSATRSAANAGNRSKRPSAERYLIARLRPSI